MTPEEYDRASRKLQRYGHRFDLNLNVHLPPAVLMTKAGQVAKRQPKYDKRPKAYYQAQCSFRGLKTTGTTEDLQQFLKGRDLGKDLAIERGLDQISTSIDAYHDDQEWHHDETWWADPSKTFEERLFQGTYRALKEEFAKPDSFLRRSCRSYPIRGSWDVQSPRLSGAAEQLGVSCQEVRGPDDVPPGRPLRQCQFIGETSLVKKHAAVFLQEAKRLAAAEWKAYKAKLEAQLKAAQAENEAQRALAMALPDWDITGKWEIQCQELATYLPGLPRNLSLEIFLDDYRLDAVCVDEKDSDHEDEYDGEIYSRSEEKAVGPKPPPEPAAQARFPRFHAKFDFGVIEGIMRIFPSPATVSRAQTVSIKANPALQYRWRGRETGEGQIELDADEHLRTITFSDLGLKLEGTFDCPYTNGPVSFTGTKLTHGSGQKSASQYDWSRLSQQAWDRGSVSRWH